MFEVDQANIFVDRFQQFPRKKDSVELYFTKKSQTLLSNDVYSFTNCSSSLPFETRCGAIFNCRDELSSNFSYSAQDATFLPESNDPYNTESSCSWTTEMKKLMNNYRINYSFQDSRNNRLSSNSEAFEVDHSHSQDVKPMCIRN
jgi:hypothetical protein